MGSTTFVSMQYSNIEYETTKAILFEIQGVKYWIPKSIVTYENGTLTIPDWFNLRCADNFNLKQENTKEVKEGLFGS